MDTKYILKLYVTGQTKNSETAIQNLQTILEDKLQGIYTLKVIDVLKDTKLAIQDKILATPTLIRVLPPPIRKLIGDLSDKEKVLIGLDLTTK